MVPESQFIPTWDNYSKFGECLQGAKLCCRALFSVSGVLQIMLFIFLHMFYVCVCVCLDCVYLKSMECVCVCLWQRGARGVIEECCRARRGRL